MEVDVLDYATGGVLSMESKDKWWRPVTFLSKSHKKKRKSRESNRIYRENKESISESRSSTKKSTSGNEVTSR